MAFYALIQQVMELRHQLQEIRRQVAYHRLNSAVAANVSNVVVLADIRARIVLKDANGNTRDTFYFLTGYPAYFNPRGLPYAGIQYIVRVGESGQYEQLQPN